MESESLINTCDGNQHGCEPITQREPAILPVSLCHIVQVCVSPEHRSTSVESTWKSTIVGDECLDTSLPSLQHFRKTPQPRIRKRKRPFSPEPIGNIVANTAERAKRKRKDAVSNSIATVDGMDEPKGFSCERCNSSFIVNPARCRVPTSQLKKKPSRRKKLDPSTNKILNLCNACGIALSRPPRKPKKMLTTIKDREKYLAEAASFAEALADQVHNPFARRLFCPAFKNRACGCIQTYLSHQGEDRDDTLEGRVNNLLQLVKTASCLGRRRNIFTDDKDFEKEKYESNSNTAARKQKQQEFENFILETRLLLREKLRLCERACQKLLLYSNNFLHKKLKSSPEQCSRLSRLPGRSEINQLKPINELSSISCCSDNCSRIAQTHSTLLEEWRKQAAEGQRQARRVLAEMLTPSGGTKANCYKFISMVTGCGSSTISSVSHQMRATKGDREPPEHGLKKWYRENPRKKSEILASHSSQSEQLSARSSSMSAQVPLVMNIQISNSDQSNFPPEHDTRLELQQQLEEARHQLLLKQQELDHCQQIIDQHLQQSLHSSSSSCSQVWKVNVVQTSMNPKADNAVAAEHGFSLSSHGDSVQLLDLIPGTYLAVPTDFNSSNYLTVSTDPKLVFSDNSVTIENSLHPEHVVLASQALHPISAIPKNADIAIAPDSGVQTILDMSGDTEIVRTVTNGENETDQTFQDGQLDLHSVSFPSSECIEAPLPAASCCTSTAPQLRPLTALHNADSTLTSTHLTLNKSRSACVSVISATGEVEPLKSVVNVSQLPGALHTDQVRMHVIGEENYSALSGTSTSSNNVIVISKPSGLHVPHSLDTFQKFF